MRTEDVPQSIRDRVAQANPRGAQVGNSAWRSMSEIKQLLAQYFPKPQRAQTKPTNLTRARDIEMGTRVRTGPDPQATLYERAWGKPKH